MPVQIGFPLELFGAGCRPDHRGTWVRVLPFRVVRLHMRFPVVASLEQFPAHSTFVSSFLWCRPLTLLFDASDTWEYRLNVKSWAPSIWIRMYFAHVPSRVILRPFRRLLSVKVLRLRGQCGHIWRVDQRPLS